MILSEHKIKEPYVVIKHGLHTQKLIFTTVQNGFVINPGIQIIDDDTIGVSVPGLTVEATMCIWADDDQIVRKTRETSKATNGRKRKSSDK
jgi:hypothetical protein